MRYEVHGIGFPNKGAELLLEYAVHRMRSILPGARFVCQPRGRDDALKILERGGLLKVFTDVKGLDVRWLTERTPGRVLGWYGLATEAASAGVLDASGFAYGDTWGSEKVRRSALRAERFRRRGGFHVLLPQSFGPFEDERVARWARRLLRASDLVFARDDDSVAHLDALGTGARIARCPDITIDRVAPGGPDDGWRPRSFGEGPQAAIVPNEKVVATGGPGGGRDRGDYLCFLAGIARLLTARGYAIGVLNHEGERDHALCTELLRMLGDGVPYVRDLGALQVKRQIGACDLVVSSRYHGAVSALSQAVPCVILGWSHKYRGLARDFGVEGWCLEGHDDAGLERVEALVAEAPATAGRLAAAAERQAEEVEGCWREVADVVARARPRPAPREAPAERPTA